MKFELTEEVIDPASWRERLLSPLAGAYCSYEGWVRESNEGRPVVELRYSAYPQLAPSVAETILAETKERFAIEAAAAVHRTGALKPGDIAVWVGVTAHHRDAAFLACRYLIDNIKFRLPVWKHEVYADGSSAWIENHSCACADPANLQSSHPPEHPHHGS